MRISDWSSDVCSSDLTVAGNAPGLERRLLKTMDPTRKQARLTFRSVPAQLLGEEGGAAAGFARTLDQAAAGLASEMAGGAERLLDQDRKSTRLNSSH